MKKSAERLVILFLGVLLLFGCKISLSLADEPLTETVIRELNLPEGAYPQRPAISDGRVVYGDLRSVGEGCRSLILYDTATNQETEIMCSQGLSYFAVISGDYVVYNAGGEVRLHDISEGGNNSVQVAPITCCASIYGENIVYTDNYKHLGTGEDRILRAVYLQNVKQLDQEPLKITDDLTAASDTDVSASNIVWLYYNGDTVPRDGPAEIWISDLDGGNQRQIGRIDEVEKPDLPYHGGSIIRIEGNYVVWHDYREGTGHDIFLYDIQNDQTTQITNHVADQYRPNISGNYIVWEDWRNGNADIYLYDIENSQELLLTGEGDQTVPDVSGNQVVWLDYQGRPQLYLADLAATGNISIPGDVNRDGVVDRSDLAIVSENFGTSSGATWEDGDMDGDGDVDLSDLAIVKRNFGKTGPTSIPGDINRDGVVDRSDLAIVSENFGTSSGATWEDGDMDGDGDVDLSDLVIVKRNFGKTDTSSSQQAPEALVVEVSPVPDQATEISDAQLRLKKQNVRTRSRRGNKANAKTLRKRSRR